MNIDLSKYTQFVDTLTSNQSKDFDFYLNSLKELHNNGCNISRLDTAVQGMMAEISESIEILNSIKFDNKELTEDVKVHLKKEMGDIVFYWINGCLSLDISPEGVIKENIAILDNTTDSDLDYSLLKMVENVGNQLEICKKMKFQGKPWSSDVKKQFIDNIIKINYHWIQACETIGYKYMDVIAENVKKLEARYPGGSFDPYYSENRKEGDI